MCSSWLEKNSILAINILYFPVALSLCIGLLFALVEGLPVFYFCLWKKERGNGGRKGGEKKRAEREMVWYGSFTLAIRVLWWCSRLQWGKESEWNAELLRPLFFFSLSVIHFIHLGTFRASDSGKRASLLANHGRTEYSFRYALHEQALWSSVDYPIAEIAFKKTFPI